MTRRVAFGGVMMDLLPGWMDTTGGEHAFTFTRPDGFGAFQLSLAQYRSGPVPAATTSVLFELLDDRADRHGLGESFDRSTDEEPLRVAAASYRADGDFIRMWYVSDGASFAFATYVRRLDLKIPDDDFAEVSDCEVMVRSIVFN